MNAESTRDAYGKALVELGKNPSIVALDADTSISTKTDGFAKQFPKRFINVGCAEQNLLGIAAGLAASGKIAYASSYALFVSGRGWEQIRNTIAHDNLDVKIVVTHAGLTNASDGSSHQSLEDIALMRSIPNMYVVVPADSVETRKVLEAAAETKGPFYIRLNRSKSPVIFDEGYRFIPGKSIALRDGSDVSLVAAGTMVEQALKAADILKNEGVSARVINLSSIKPIDTQTLVSAAKETGAIVTAEEHSVHGGVGSAVAEVIAERCPVPLRMVGASDRFGQSGEYEELIRIYGLSAEDIAGKAREAIKAKK